MSLQKPDILQDVGEIPTNQSTSTTTSVLDAVIHNETMCRFVLENKGRLHGNSKIILGVKETTDKAFFPINLGVHSLINRVVFKVGAKEISSISDFNHFMAYRNCFTPNEQNFERNSITNGTLLDYCVDHDKGFTGNTSINTGLCTDTTGVIIQAYNDLANTPTYQIRLVDMFPWLGQIQLPLYLMKEQCAIELFFETNNKKRYCIPKNGTDPTPVLVDHENTKLVADYIYYPQPVMDNYESQIKQTGLTIPILEYALITTSLTATGGNINMTRNVGGANRMVSKVIIMNSDADYTNETLYNEFGSNCGDTFSLNIKYNNVPLYPQAITNFGHAFNQIHNAEGVPMFVAAPEYSGQIPDIFTPTEFEGYQLNQGLTKIPRTYFASKLNGERINAAGIEIHMTMAGADDLTNRVYLEQACMLTLKDGKMSKSYV